jgi:hypothetical protein
LNQISFVPISTKRISDLLARLITGIEANTRMGGQTEYNREQKLLDGSQLHLQHLLDLKEKDKSISSVTTR